MSLAVPVVHPPASPGPVFPTSPRFRHPSAALRRLLLGLLFLLAAPTHAVITPPADLALDGITSIGDTVTGIVNAGDGSDRLFILGKGGLISIYDLQAETLLPTPFLDVSSLLGSTNSEMGLLGLAFHPNYAQNGVFYVSHTISSGPRRSVLARYSVSANPNVGDAASRTVVLEVEQTFSNHNGGDVHFGPDGYLYWGLGDGGDGGDPFKDAQNPLKLLGKMLRIDVDTPPEEGPSGLLCGAGTEYSIPPTNPFAGEGSTCDEIWALGLRNPWRFTFDALTGDLYIADVGQNAWEEVDFQPASSSGGENYGWDCREGLHFFEDCSPTPTTVDPVLEYGHGISNCSITGGHVYRGSMPALQGAYVYADLCSGNLWFADNDGGWNATLWNQTIGGATAFGLDEQGELYVGAGGQVLTFTSDTRALFADGFESGDVGDWDGSAGD